MDEKNDLLNSKVVFTQLNKCFNTVTYYFFYFIRITKFQRQSLTFFCLDHGPLLLVNIWRLGNGRKWFHKSVNFWDL